MIKGINREMIEVTHTGSPYFERAFLVVRHGSTRPPDEVLHTIAQRVVEQADSYAGLRRQHRRLLARRVLLAVLSALGGAGALLLCQRLLF